MKKVIISALTAFAIPAFAYTTLPPQEMTKIAGAIPVNTITKEHSSVKESPARTMIPARTVDYPTQVVRVRGNITGPAKSCDDVFAKIDEFYTNYITWDKFFYNTIMYCGYDPETNNARSFSINSYFDPLDDAAVAYLEKYLAQHNGRKLLGTTFTIESAKGVVVSLNIDAGLEDESDPFSLMRYQHDNEGYYYTSNYAMRMALINDIYKRFYTNDPDLILPFITSWFKTSIMLYERVLSQSNFVEMQPELVFVMDNESKIFTPNLRLYYTHVCSKYENGRCL